ncbi:MAG TPA: dihydrofolate reductase [Xanthomonadaceae bacterium]|jgi:dihydrofolate reductase|nr:dihydrofolate reductase [Xanthomonadaceae bacterium]
MTRIALIAALDRHNAIGKNNALPWHLPDDLKRFKALTLDKSVLMGRKTAESLGRALPGRRNLVLTRSGRVPFVGMEEIASLDAALEIVGDQELMVIGGGDVFALALPLAERMHLTHVDTVVADADAFFPGFDASQWRVVSREPHQADSKHAFAFELVAYARSDRLDKAHGD